MTNQQPPFGGGFPQPGPGNSGSGGSSVWGSGAPSAQPQGNSPWGNPAQEGQDVGGTQPPFGGAQPSSPWGAPGATTESFERPTDPFAAANAAEGGYSGQVPGSSTAPSISEAGGTVSREPSSAPATWLIPGLVLGVIALVLTIILLTGNVSPVTGTYAGMAFGAWALAGVFGVSSLAFYFSEDTKRRANGMYSIVGWKQGLYWATLAVLLIAIILSSLCIALWAGRL